MSESNEEERVKFYNKLGKSQIEEIIIRGDLKAKVEREHDSEAISKDGLGLCNKQRKMISLLHNKWLSNNQYLIFRAPKNLVNIKKPSRRH